MPADNDVALGKQVDDGLKELFEKILKPAGPADPLMLGGPLYDNVAWVDFTDVRFAIDPRIVNAKAPHAPFVAPVDRDLDQAAEVEEQGGASDLYLQFVNDMRNHLEKALVQLFTVNIDCVLSYIPDPGPGHRFEGREATVTYYSATGELQATYEWVPPNAGFLYTETHTAAFKMRELSLCVTRAATETPALIAELMSIYDAVVTSASAASASSADANPVELFWTYLTDSMTTGLGFPNWLWVQHYVNLHNFMLAGTATESPEYRASRDDHWPRTVGALETQFSAEMLAGQLYEAPPAVRDHHFVTFEPYTINCGLRLVYRQTWRHLGNQRGEVVRTIPLGPKQTEKVSTKFSRRTKFSKTAEDIKSTETTTETSDSTKDSSEVIHEALAAKNFKMNVSTEASVNIGVFSGKTNIEGSGGEEKSEKSGEKQAHLSEMMQKTASKMRQETKVVVSTESEESFEITTASEITNPNDEIAVTYVYSKLQRQFQILTQLAELQDVIMVAEPLPRPHEIDAGWVKRYDWILSKALLDDSYRDALNSITQDSGVFVRNTIAADLKEVMKSTVASLGALAGTASSISKIDFVSESQKNYREMAAASAAATDRQLALKAQRERLYQHICDNVLYYCRAIYAQEDPQQRVLRYQHNEVRVPLDWRWAALEIDGPGTYPIRWVPVPSEMGGRWVDMIDAINPAGPIGYFGNCAMYYIRPELRGIASNESSRPVYSKTLFELLDLDKEPYLLPALDADNQEFPDPYQEHTVMDPVLIDLLVNGCRQSEVTDDKLNDDIAREMSNQVPALRMMAAEKEVPYIADKSVLKKYYAEYQFLKKQSRLCVIDTNSLMIDLLPGDGSTLEPFKQAHRGMDVLKVREETRRIERENERRHELIKEKIYGDPDVEKVVEIRSDKTVGAVIAMDTSEE